MLRSLLIGLLAVVAIVASALPVVARQYDPSLFEEGSDAGWGSAEAEAEHEAFREQVIDLTFPLPEGSTTVIDTYWSPRSGGRIHRASDLMVAHMTPIFAAVGGTVCSITGLNEPMPSWGYALTVCGDDGLRYDYLHINNDTPGTDDGQGGVEHAYVEKIIDGGVGTRVARGEHIAWAGDSGNAENSGHHLHFEICDHEYGQAHGDPSSYGCKTVGRINPYNSLLAAQARGDYPDSVTPLPAGPSGGGDESDHDHGDEDDERQPVTLSVERLAGDSRVETAVELSRATRSSARTVIVVPADSHVEALVAAPLAGFLDAPILLSTRDGLPRPVADEVGRLDALNAYVIGTTSQLSSQVEQDLRNAGVANLARLAADDRYDLSADIAAEIASYPSAPAFDEVLLALGDAADASRAWPDALSASALAARTVTPILLVESQRLPRPVADLLGELRPDRIRVVGGTAAISNAVADAAAYAAGDATVTRLSGDTRYATSARVADAARDAGLDDGAVFVATGRNYPDALAAGPAAARSGSPLLLIDGENPAGSPESVTWLEEHADSLVVVGGPAVITDEAVLAASAR